MTSLKDVDLTDAGLNGKLIGHLKSDDFFSVEKYPEAALVITEKAGFNGNQAHVKGDLTVKGITNPVEFDVTKRGMFTQQTSLLTAQIQRTLRFKIFLQ